MAFASPWYLLGLLAIGIPVAIHLIRRPQAERIVLPTARFIKTAPKKLVFIQQIQQWLLLALRVAIVGLLAVAFARPIVTGAYSKIAGGQPKSLIILVDTSMSMQYGDRFEQARAAAIDIVRSLNTGDQAGVVAFAESPVRTHPLTTDHAALESFVSGLPVPGYQSTNLLTALHQADQLLQAARYPERVVYLVSDFQKSAMPAGRYDWKWHPGIELKFVAVGSTATYNLAVVEGNLDRKEDTHTFVGRIQNTGTNPVEEVQVSLEIDGRLLESRTINLEGRAEIRVAFPFTLDQTGLHRGRLTIAGDRFGPDNTYYFLVDVAPVKRVLCVGAAIGSGGGADESYWFRAALDQTDEASFQVDVIDPGRLTIETLASYAVVALINVDDLTPEQVRALRAYVNGGGGLLLAPADRVGAHAYNRHYGDVTPALLRQKKTDADGTTLAIDRAHAPHPVVRNLQVGEKTDFGTARFYQYWVADPVSDSKVIMRFANGDPALIAKSVSNGRALLFTSSLDPAWNNFPRQVTYLPLLHEALRHLAGNQDTRMSFRVGDVVPIDVPAGGGVRVTSPGGEAALLRSAAAGFAFYPATAQPGFYRTRSGNLTGGFAVNVAARESELVALNPQEMGDRLMSAETPETPTAAAQTASSRTALENAQQYWWWVLLLVLAMSLLETFLANRTYR